ncbi:MAG: hypothetical protein JRJ82_01910 [Deltaproteobacteria bacterium]|nr:hypothetical protein [Deltaproteobacteria bacterium]
MVRFADIVTSKIKLGVPNKITPVRVGENAYRFADLQVLEQLAESTSVPKYEEEGPTFEVIGYYDELLELAQDIGDRVKRNKKIDPFPILSIIHSITAANLTDELYEYAMSSTVDYEELPGPTMEATFASMKVGEGMGYDEKMLIKLGLTAFLENVGIYKVPEGVLTKKGKLDEKEIKTIKSHPIISYKILSGMGEKFRWLALLALQTHERSDGSGYPKGLKEDEISEMASIIGLTETYIAMIKRTPYRDPYSRPDAVKFIIEDAKLQFPIKVLKAFFNEISLYPVNTYVRLNSQAIGRVQSTNKRRPLRPRIALLYDSEGKRITSQKVIDLSEDPLFYIVESIDKKDLP